ncbi:MAG: CotH kinase family protein [Saonia sp.]
MTHLKNSTRIFGLLIYSIFSVNCQAQQVMAKDGSFGIDKTNKIIVWHNKNIDPALPTKAEVGSFIFNEKFDVVHKPILLSYSNALKLAYKEELYTLYITKLPIVHITVEKTVQDDSKILGYFTYFNDDKYIKNVMGIEYRGNLSLTFPKKSYDLELWTDSINKKSNDVKFEGLRSDDDWILDGLYNEPLRMRSNLAAKLWLEIHQPHYLSSEPKAKSGFDVRYVEVFKNGQYIGIHSLSESVDRKQLALKRNDKQIIHGELFKASSYEGAPAFKKAPDHNNLFPHWGGFEMRYPMVDGRFHWENLNQFIDLIVHGEDEEFALKIGRQLDMDNAIDYYLLVNLLRATDNLGKNYYLARYQEKSPYFFVPWDLDGVMGIIQDGKRIPTTNDVLSNGLFDRLLKINPDGFRDRLKLRWTALRKTVFSDSKLFSKIEQTYFKLKSEKIYERELMVWPGERTIEDDYEYLNQWLRDRLIYLDVHFENL